MGDDVGGGGDVARRRPEATATTTTGRGTIKPMSRTMRARGMTIAGRGDDGGRRDAATDTALVLTYLLLVVVCLSSLIQVDTKNNVVRHQRECCGFIADID